MMMWRIGVGMAARLGWIFSLFSCILHFVLDAAHIISLISERELREGVFTERKDE